MNKFSDLIVDSDEELSVSLIDKIFDESVLLWHESKTDLELHDFLGMTFEMYKDIIQDHSVLYEYSLSLKLQKSLVGKKFICKSNNMPYEVVEEVPYKDENSNGWIKSIQYIPLYDCDIKKFSRSKTMFLTHFTPLK